MEFYLILFVVFLVLSASGLFGTRTLSDRPMFFIIFVLAVFVAFRVDVGDDWALYRDTY